MKIRPVGAELFHAVGRTDGQTDIANRRFRNFVKAPNSQSLNPHLFQIVILASASSSCIFTVCCVTTERSTEHHI